MQKEKESVDQIYKKEIWTPRETVLVLGCSIGHVYNLTSKRKIPFVKKSGMVRMMKEDILNWLLEGDL